MTLVPVPPGWVWGRSTQSELHSLSSPVPVPTACTLPSHSTDYTLSNTCSQMFPQKTANTCQVSCSFPQWQTMVMSLYAPWLPQGRSYEIRLWTRLFQCQALFRDNAIILTIWVMIVIKISESYSHFSFRNDVKTVKVWWRSFGLIHKIKFLSIKRLCLFYIHLNNGEWNGALTVLGQSSCIRTVHKKLQFNTQTSACTLCEYVNYF